MQAIPAPLLFFMTSEMTEKFFTIAPTNTFRKMNAPASGGAAIVSVTIDPSSGTALSFVTGEPDRSIRLAMHANVAHMCIAKGLILPHAPDPRPHDAKDAFFRSCARARTNAHTNELAHERTRPHWSTLPIQTHTMKKMRHTTGLAPPYVW